MEVIEKFFSQITGIKQKMEKIDSNPTVTICPFQNQCDGMILRLQGWAKEILSHYEGSYQILSFNLINGKPYWTHKNGKTALMYNSQLKMWIFGPVQYGGERGDIASKSYENTKWHYLNNTEWISTNIDVIVDLG